MTPDSVEPTANLVLSAEVPHTTVRRVPAERVRISRRVVTETRTVTVEVRREELHVERMSLPSSADTGTGTGPARSGTDPVLTWLLHEEIPEVVNRVVAVERVQVFIDDVDGTETVDVDLRHEEARLTQQDLPGR
jgi:uncharacterized protein (TIGR02271 family)